MTYGSVNPNAFHSTLAERGTALLARLWSAARAPHRRDPVRDEYLHLLGLDDAIFRDIGITRADALKALREHPHGL